MWAAPGVLLRTDDSRHGPTEGFAPDRRRRHGWTRRPWAPELAVSWTGPTIGGRGGTSSRDAGLSMNGGTTDSSGTGGSQAGGITRVARGGCPRRERQGPWRDR